MGRVVTRTPPISGISYSTGVAMLVWGKDQRLLRVKDLMGSCGWFWVQMHDTSMATCSSDVQGRSWQPRDFLNLHIMTGLCNYLTNPLRPSFFPLSIARHHWTRTPQVLSLFAESSCPPSFPFHPSKISPSIWAGANTSQKVSLPISSASLAPWLSNISKPVPSNLKNIFIVFSDVKSKPQP